MVYAYLRYAEGITLNKQASSVLLDPRVLGALAGGAVGLGTAALSGRRDEEGNKDKPWLRNALIGAGLGGLLGHFGFSGGEQASGLSLPGNEELPEAGGSLSINNTDPAAKELALSKTDMGNVAPSPEEAALKSLVLSKGDGKTPAIGTFGSNTTDNNSGLDMPMSFTESPPTFRKTAE